jgi:hypothetical protein
MVYDSSDNLVRGLYLANPQDENPPPTLNFSKDPLISTDEVYTVILDASAFASMGPGDNANASVDPTITIDPSNADADAYSLDFSDGLTTPLPSTWFMLLSGLAGLAFFAYRGTKNGSAAFAAA